MRKHRVLLQGIAGSLATFGLAAMAMAAAPDIVVTDARIEAGKLVVTGKTAVAGTRVRLDGRSQADFNTTSGGNRTFRFELVYLPRDCMVSLQKVQGSQPGAEIDAVIANCAPPVAPRGSWSEKSSYDSLDLVSHGGSSWLAMRKRANGEPGKSKDWQLFAAGVSDGKSGPKGPGGSALAAGTGGGATRLNPEAAPTGPAGGDLAGTYPNPTIATEAVTTGKIAARAVTTAKIKDAAVIEKKLADGAVTAIKILDGAVTELKIAPLSINASHIQLNAINSGHIQTDAVQATEIANDSIDAGEIVDFGLTNQDIGVLFAQVNADGTLASSSGSVTSSRISLGNYEVDFGHTVSACAAVMTQGEAGVGGAAGGITAVTDRSGNAEAFFATMRSDANALVDRAFQLVVVC